MTDPPNRRERFSAAVATYSARAQDAGEKHASIAVPFRAMRRNQRVAASVLSGGFAYKLFIWLLPVIGDASRDADWGTVWLLVLSVPGLAWAGWSGAKRRSSSTRWCGTSRRRRVAVRGSCHSCSRGFSAC